MPNVIACIECGVHDADDVELLCPSCKADPNVHIDPELLEYMRSPAYRASKDQRKAAMLEHYDRLHGRQPPGDPRIEGR